MGRSLRVRLLVSSIVVAVCSIAATAWLAVQGTSGAIRQQQGQALAADQKIYDKLLEHATERPIWDNLDGLLRDLENETGRRITLTTERRQLIAGEDVNPLPVNASAVVDPLDVDPTLKTGAGIDPRAVGPFKLTPDESAGLLRDAEALQKCLDDSGYQAAVVVSPSGRAMLEAPGLPVNVKQLRCTLGGVGVGGNILGAVTPTENKGLADLQEMVEACVGGGTRPLFLNAAGIPVASPRFQDENTTKCLNDSRLRQLDRYTAPRALLFITNREGAPEMGLTGAGTTRIVAAALAVLLLTIVVSFVVATRLVRPLKALTVAAQQMRGGDTTARVETRTTGEIGEVADAFNEMAEHLERTEEQRKAMIGDVSHELRTPLGNIRGWLVATQDGVADLDDELVGSLLEETMLLQHLVDDLQQLALADAGQLKIHPERVDLGEVLDQFAAHSRVVVRRSGDLHAEADPIRIRQAIGNLVTNALKHSEGEVVLTGHKNGQHIQVDVQDDGTGIAEEDLPHVFERFWRADKSRSRQTGGSGLGLAIVKHLVALHGGTIAVRSALGNGSTFTLKLPS